MSKDSEKSGDKPKGEKVRDDKGGADDTSTWNLEAIPEALREATKRAADLAQNPYARSLLAAGLVAAAAALTANKNTREATRRNFKGATDAAEAAAHQAGEAGAAIVNVVSDAVQHMLSAAGLSGSGAKAADGGKNDAKSAPVPAKAADAPPPAKSKTKAGKASAAESGSKKASKPKAGGKTASAKGRAKKSD